MEGLSARDLVQERFGSPARRPRPPVCIRCGTELFRASDDAWLHASPTVCPVVEVFQEGQ
jgi:hypothetical protein